MSSWFPEVATITPERSLILELIRVCKSAIAQNRARISVLQSLASQGRSAVANQIADAVQNATPPAREDLDVLFRSVESDLVSGREYQHNLRSLLSKL